MPIDFRPADKISKRATGGIDFRPIDTPPETWAAKLGIENPAIRAVIDALEGVSAGAASTVFHGGDIVRRITGQERIIDKPDVRQAMTAPESAAGAIGKVGEQIAEFAVPLTKVAKATRGGSMLARVLSESGMSALVAGTQTGGDPVATGVAATLGAAAPAAGKVASAVVDKGKLATRLYLSAAKPTWAMTKKEGREMVKTGLEEAIPVSHSGLGVAEQKIARLGQQIREGIQTRAEQGATVVSTKVLSALDDLENFYKQTAAPDDALKILQQIKDEFVEYHGKNVPLDLAQKLKVNTYRLLKKSYGEMRSAKIEGLKQVARGLKEQISEVFPEIRALNEKQSKLLGLDDMLYRAVWRIENHQMMGIGSPIAATAGHAIMGGPGAVVSLLGKFVLDSPKIKSKIAIALARAGNPNPAASVSKGLATLKGTIQEFGASVSSRLQPSEI